MTDRNTNEIVVFRNNVLQLIVKSNIIDTRKMIVAITRRKYKCLKRIKTREESNVLLNSVKCLVLMEIFIDNESNWKGRLLYKILKK